VNEMEGFGIIGHFSEWDCSKLHKMTFKSLISTCKILTLLSYDGQR